MMILFAELLGVLRGYLGDQSYLLAHAVAGVALDYLLSQPCLWLGKQGLQKVLQESLYLIDG